MRKRLVFALAVVGLLSAWSRETEATITTFGCAGATSCTLAELFVGGSIRVETKLFDDWELEFVDPDGVLPDFTMIVVEGRDDGGLVPGQGVEFSGNGELLVVGADRLDMAIGFTVTELDPTVFMHDNSLEILADTVLMDATLTVGEFVADGSGIGLGQKEVETDPAFGTAMVLDAIEFTVVQQKLIIEKDILLVGRAAGDSAELDMFEQRFSQLPEPDGLLMLCVGVVALCALRHRTSST